MSKKIHKTAKRGKDKQNYVEPVQFSEAAVQVEEKVIVEEKIGPIKIILECYQSVVGFFQISSIQTKCSFLEKVIGETAWIPVSDDEFLDIDETFYLDVDINSVKHLNRLISSPVVVSVYQMMEAYDPNLQDQLQNSIRVSSITSKVFEGFRESIISVYEPIPDQALEFAEESNQKEKASPKGKKSKSPKKGKNRSSASEPSTSKASMKTKATKKPVKTKLSKIKSKSTSSTSATTSGSAIEIRKEVMSFGMCTIDLLPLFYGQKSFSETILIKPVRKYGEEQMKTYETNPKIVVTVSVEEDINIIGSTIMNCTVESIYNIPLLMTPEMEYMMCGIISVNETEKCCMMFANPKYTTQISEESNRLWPGVQNIGFDAYSTKYRMSSDEGSILCKLEDDILPYLKQDNPRLEFNMIRRNFLLRDGMNNLAAHIKTHRHLVMEFYMTTKVSKKSSSNVSSQKLNKSSKRMLSATSESSQNSHESFKKPTSKQQPFLHLMTILDVSTLLYPGVRCVRVASPLTTFSKEDALKFGGLKDSYFSQSDEENIQQKQKGSPKKSKGGKKDKGSKEKKSTQSSRSTKDVIKESTDESPEEAPPEPEPSMPVFDENGKPCFIIVEIELSKPIVPEHDVEDLTERLKNMLKKLGHTSIKIEHPKGNPLRDILNDIIQDINKNFPRFLESNCSRKVINQTTDDFLNFIKSTGAYRDYLTAISEIATPLVKSRIGLGMDIEKNNKHHQNLISGEFVYFVEGMNETLNKLACQGMEPAIGERFLNNTLFFAKEALEMKDPVLAKRYLLERISSDGKNPNYWFDYAVYSMEMKDDIKAYVCIKEALLINPAHKYSLLFFAILLDERNLKEEAEACLLNLTIQAPRWSEGWAILYLFYKKYENYEGMDVSLAMAKKYVEDERTPIDYFTYFEDLAWTYKICPTSIFFRAATSLLKMRLYDWTERCLSEENNNHSGLVNYLLSAICYYKGLYSDALQHIEKTKSDYGLNYAIAALSGHCLYALNKMGEAKQEYCHTLGYINRPNFIHLVYLNYADILEKCGDYQESKKILLLANKYTPTPTSWLKTGLLYFKENDLLGAEECFREGNLIDHRRYELWENLCSINLKLNRPHEAELCNQQAINHKLEKQRLEKGIEN
nr:cilia- and flagella-associated protein 70-like isoform X1 [Leptinotarsa decemlineata]